jgi:hypothetical protein
LGPDPDADAEANVPVLDAEPGVRNEPKSGPAVIGGVRNGECSKEAIDDVGVSWTLSGRFRRGGGAGGLNVDGETCLSERDRPTRALMVSRSGEPWTESPEVGCSSGLRSGCVGGGGSRREGDRDCAELRPMRWRKGLFDTSEVGSGGGKVGILRRSESDE